MAKDRLAELRAQGFDKSHRRRRGKIDVGCSRCVAVVINGTACHEQGCSNKRRNW